MIFRHVWVNVFPPRRLWHAVRLCGNGSIGSTALCGIRPETGTKWLVQDAGDFVTAPPVMACPTCLRRLQSGGAK